MLSRRGTFGLAALLALVERPTPAPAAARFDRWLGPTEVIHGEVLELRCVGEGVQIPLPGGPALPPVTRATPAAPAPWGWDTLENVR
jgi:hypothetical protein